jgi:uncharacterized membrane protein YedE/YeeE
MNFLTNTWHWSISGFLIGLIMIILTYFGRNFGMSSNLRTMCTIVGSKKFSNYFDFDWREQKWNLAIVVGSIFGGFIATYFLNSHAILNINPNAISKLHKMGVDAPNGKLGPDVLFSLDAVLSLKGFILLIFGGFLIGFGTPYAGGCTSGHAISGLSNLQIPSLIAVIGFFIGGLIMSNLILPYLF